MHGSQVPQSILDVRLDLPVVISEITDGLFSPGAELYEPFRVYLALVRDMDFELREQEATYAQEFFVKKRQDNKKISVRGCWNQCVFSLLIPPRAIPFTFG